MAKNNRIIVNFPPLFFVSAGAHHTTWRSVSPALEQPRCSLPGERAGARAPSLPTEGAIPIGVSLSRPQVLLSQRRMRPRLGTEARHPAREFHRSTSISSVMIWELTSISSKGFLRLIRLKNRHTRISGVMKLNNNSCDDPQQTVILFASEFSKIFVSSPLYKLVDVHSYLPPVRYMQPCFWRRCFELFR